MHDYRERLLGELSHDLRAPLNVVVTRSEQLLRSDPPADVRAQAVNIRIAALGALEQINDMLEQVKADHGEAQLALVDADLARAVRTVAESFEPLATDRDIELSVETPDSLAAHFDVERVSRIVSNLLANAIRHTPRAASSRAPSRPVSARRHSRSPIRGPAFHRSTATECSGAFAQDWTAMVAQAAPEPASA